MPEMAAHAGYSFGELVRWMVEDASVRPLSAGVPGGAAACDEPSLPAPLDPLPPLPRPAAVPARALGRRPARAPPAALSRHRACLRLPRARRRHRPRARRACPGAASDLRRAASCPRPRARPRHRAGHDRRHRGPDRGRGPERRRHLAARVAAVPRACARRASGSRRCRSSRARPCASSTPTSSSSPSSSATPTRCGRRTASSSSSRPTAPSSTPSTTARFAYLPLVVGEQANLHTRDYLALLEAAGPLKSRIRAGTLVSGRRWTLKMDNGIDVRLPEHGAKDALAAPRQARARAGHPAEGRDRDRPAHAGPRRRAAHRGGRRGARSKA